jgi:hypothetical protein
LWFTGVKSILLTFIVLQLQMCVNRLV